MAPRTPYETDLPAQSEVSMTPWRDLWIAVAFTTAIAANPVLGQTAAAVGAAGAQVAPGVPDFPGFGVIQARRASSRRLPARGQ